MNICFVALDYPMPSGGGGVGNQVRTLSKFLVREGHNVSVLALRRQAEAEFFEEEGVQIHSLSSGNLHWYFFKTPFLGPLLTLPLREFEYGWAVYQKIKSLHHKKNFNIIEGTETGCFWISLLMKVPLIIRLHGEHYTFHKYTPDAPLTLGIRWNRFLQRVAIRRAKRLISPSRAHAEEIKKEFKGNHPPIEIISNAIDLEKIPVADGSQREKATVLFVGRLDRYKGIPVLLEAAGQVVKEIPEVHFVLAGAFHPTLPEAEIQSMLDRYQIRRQVLLTGHLPWEKLKEWYQRATIFVLPSYYETFGLAALEAMAFGLPVVAARTGALPELIEDGVSGLLVPAGDPKTLASAIIFLFQQPLLRKKMGEKACEQAKRFDVKYQMLTLEKQFGGK